MLKIFCKIFLCCAILALVLMPWCYGGRQARNSTIASKQAQELRSIKKVTEYF
jgi:hypothetical protein